MTRVTWFAVEIIEALASSNYRSINIADGRTVSCGSCVGVTTQTTFSGTLFESTPLNDTYSSSESPPYGPEH